MTKVHADTTTELILSIRKIVLGLRSVERHVNGTGPQPQQQQLVMSVGNDNDDDNINSSTRGGGGGYNNSSSSSLLSSITKEQLISFRTSLEEKCPIPLDLLDLLDYVGGAQSVGGGTSGSGGGQQIKTTSTLSSQVFGLNPQVYARGLLSESKRQLAGLERRKRALAMLATSIEEGMKKREKQISDDDDGMGIMMMKKEKVEDETTTTTTTTKKKNGKRKCDELLSSSSNNEDSLMDNDDEECGDKKKIQRTN